METILRHRSNFQDDGDDDWASKMYEVGNLESLDFRCFVLLKLKLLRDDMDDIGNVNCETSRPLKISSESKENRFDFLNDLHKLETLCRRFAISNNAEFDCDRKHDTPAICFLLRFLLIHFYI